MTPKALANLLFSTYEQFRLNHLQPATCVHGAVEAELRDMSAGTGGVLDVQEIGRSLEGRSINMVTFGRGPRKVLLWSQMHGDEPTATLALMDIFNFLRQVSPGEAWVREMGEQTTIHAIPMLNPDGAERFQRWTAAQIDMNRDARLLVTPEARVLDEVHRRISPAFGFNLHDQPLYSVGTTTNVAALSLLAPALDESRSTPLSRIRAIRVGALVASTLGQYIAGHIARYDDSFEPRAFGDVLQSRGTSTLLIESGHWPADPEKAFIRKLNFVALLTALRSIGNGSYQDVELDFYSTLKPNGRQLYELIIRDVLLQSNGEWSERVDLGLTFVPERSRTREARVVVKEIGDLSTHGGLESIAAGGRRLPAPSVSIEKVIRLSDLLSALQLYHDKFSAL